jgi:nucleoside 2-deoxyribosyltransferase
MKSKEVIVPALKSNSLDPKRVDKHNKGELLKSEITAFIEASDIIVADLTNERQNCYLEVGYVMGQGKYSNLILTAREDHNLDSPTHKVNGPKVHFDLTGYGILWWDANKLEEFKNELDKRIKRRLKTITPLQNNIASTLNEEWFKNCQLEAYTSFRKRSQAPYMEVRMALINSKINVEQRDLLQTAERAQMNNSEWPIGLANYGKGGTPRATKEGISAQIVSSPHYDCWALNKDGSFYLLRNLWETELETQNHHIMYDMRIRQLTEVLLYSLRLYQGLGALPDDLIYISVKHGGLRGYNLDSSERRFFVRANRSQEDESLIEIEITLAEIEQPNIVALVEKFTKPLFTLFDFFEISRKTLEDNIAKFISNKY